MTPDPIAGNPIDLAPDYRVASSSPPQWGLGGGPLSGSFTIDEVAGNDGVQDIAWAVYVSSDAVLDPGDAPAVDSGTEGALSSLGSTTVNYSNATGWPVTQGYYYVLIDISAGDDINGLNDRNVPTAAAHIPVAGSQVNETAANNDSPSFQDLFPSLGAFEAGDLVRIGGTMDAAAGNDTYQVTLSNTTNPRKIEVTVVWSGGNAIDAAINGTWSTSTYAGREPGPTDGQFRVTGLTPGSSYLVTVEFTGAEPAGTVYHLFVNTTQ